MDVVRLFYKCASGSEVLGSTGRIVAGVDGQHTCLYGDEGGSRVGVPPAVASGLGRYLGDQNVGQGERVGLDLNSSIGY